MPIHFTDVDGVEGTISPSLTVDYDGYWEDDVVEFVSRVRRADLPDDPELDQLDTDSQLLLALPEAAPIVAVERDTAIPHVTDR